MVRTLSSPPRRRSLLGSLLLLSLVCAGAMGFGGQARAQASLPPGLSAPAKPTAMPAFELPTTAGTPLRSDALRGQVVVIRFWASW
jgi:cytochrome oxidase Cu insertion factor (SCO1/SenC/PrrC family)